MSIVHRIERDLYELIVFKTSKLDRLAISSASLVGSGIEIGAMDLPLRVKRGVDVKYFDRISKESSAKIFPEIADKLVHVDILGDGETLEGIDSDSLDFIIGNHFIEHTENPISTIYNMLRVLKKGGKVFMAIPDKRFTFDIDREITPLSHLLKDYEQGVLWSRENHYYDFVKHTEHGIGKSDELAFLFDIEVAKEALPGGNESIFVLRKN
jgi:SAM-dependent methyltransferase